LGISPEYDGLAINPCIPSKWDGFKMKRVFRDVTYNIEVKNPEHISKGIKKILVNGTAINSNIVPILEKGKEHSVEVIMG
jgi:cellobiose phosphorylase